MELAARLQVTGWATESRLFRVCVCGCVDERHGGCGDRVSVPVQCSSRGHVSRWRADGRLRRGSPLLNRHNGELLLEAIERQHRHTRLPGPARLELGAECHDQQHRQAAQIRRGELAWAGVVVAGEAAHFPLGPTAGDQPDLRADQGVAISLSTALALLLALLPDRGETV